MMLACVLTNCLALAFYDFRAIANMEENSKLEVVDVINRVMTGICWFEILVRVA